MTEANGDPRKKPSMDDVTKKIPQGVVSDGQAGLIVGDTESKGNTHEKKDESEYSGSKLS